MELFASALSLAYKYLGPPNSSIEYGSAISLVWKGSKENEAFPLLCITLPVGTSKEYSLFVQCYGESVENPLELVGKISAEIVRRETACHARNEA